MKKILIVISLLLVFMPLDVEAFSGKIKIECEKTMLTPGESTDCSLLVDSDELLASLDVGLVFPTVLNLDSIAPEEDVWTGPVEGKRLSLVTSEELKGENIKVATFKITAKEIATPSLDSIEAKIDLKNIEIYTSADNHEKKGVFDPYPESILVVSEGNSGTDIPIISDINFSGNDIVKFPPNTNGELGASEGYDLKDYELRYQYVGLTSKQDALIAKAYKEQDLQGLINNLPPFDTEKWTDIGSDYLVPFNGEKSESGNYILYIELVDKDNNVTYAYDYVVSDSIEDYVGPSTADSLPLIIVSMIVLGGTAIYGYKRMRESN